MTWPLADRHDARHPGRFRRSAVHVVGPVLGRHAPRPRLVERKHLRAASLSRSPTPSTSCRRRSRRCRSTRSRRTPSSATTCSSSRRSRSPGFGMFLLGTELTGAALRRIRSPGSRSRSRRHRIANIPHLHGAVLGVDAVRAVRAAQVFRDRTHGDRWRVRRGRVARAELCRAATTCSSSRRIVLLLHRVGAHETRLVDAMPDAARTSAWRSVPGSRATVAVPAACTSNCGRLGFSPRSLAETRRFSADVYAYFTADPNLRLWGSIAQAWPKSEGLLFPRADRSSFSPRSDFDVQMKPPRPRRTLRQDSLCDLCGLRGSFFVVAELAVVVTRCCSASRSGCRDQDHEPVARLLLVCAGVAARDRSRGIAANSRGRADDGCCRPPACSRQSPCCHRHVASARRSARRGAW